MKKMLFVCTGNICRSPSAEAVFMHVVRRRGLSDLYWADSAGTHGYHVGEPADDRAIAAAEKRGIDLGEIVARKVRVQDFEKFDHIIALDQGHFDILQGLQPEGSKAELSLFLDYTSDKKGQDVPDPYYGSLKGFDDVLDLLEEGTDGILKTLV